MRVRLLVNDQFGDLGPRAGDEGKVVATTYDEGEKWYFVVFESISSSGYFVVREDMIEEV